VNYEEELALSVPLFRLIKEVYMHILMYNWRAFSNDYLFNNLRELGGNVDVWSDPDILEPTERAIEKLKTKLKNNYDLVVSFNYFRGVATACEQTNIPYAAWTQDAPLWSLYDDTIRSKNNYFFCFDSEQYKHLKEKNIKNVFYLPLGVDVERLEKKTVNITADKKSKYRADISFVGSLYKDTAMFDDIVAKLSEYSKGYLYAICNMQLKVPEIRFSEIEISKEVMRELQRKVSFEGEGYIEVELKKLFENIVDRKVTAIERNMMVEICRKYQNFKIYTNSSLDEALNKYNQGIVDYYTDMPLVFNQSKININLSARPIHYGIPLRVLDIIASNGFVLTNAQPDLFLYFEEGKSIATFQCIEELEDKIDYYMNHETERINIRNEGKAIVKSIFDYKTQIKTIFECVGI